MIKRTAVLLTGLFFYLFGVSSLLAWIFVMLGVMHFAAGPFEVSGTPMQIAFGFFLMFLFGLQHSVMARPGFKKWWTTLVPAALERAIYVFAAGVILWLILILWPHMPSVVWNVEVNLARKLIYAIAIGGWAYLFLASFAINHFELFGVEQVYRYFRQQEMPNIPFKEKWMYAFDRHPIMTGALVGTWATPTMRFDHLLFSICTTLYIIVGVYYEEKDLLTQWGDGYKNYCKRVMTIVPGFRGQR
jgi:protein-S-isoprenylcysteine O-methyltransferase Ste14